MHSARLLGLSGVLLTFSSSDCLAGVDDPGRRSCWTWHGVAQDSCWYEHHGGTTTATIEQHAEELQVSRMGWLFLPVGF